MFRPADVRRVQAAYDTDLLPPYDVILQCSPDRLALRAIVQDPDDARLTVHQAEWWFDERAARDVKQPSDDEIGHIVKSAMIACAEYPAKKAADAIAQAEKEARQAALAAAKKAQAEEDAAALMGPESAAYEA